MNFKKILIGVKVNIEFFLEILKWICLKDTQLLTNWIELFYFSLSLNLNLHIMDLLWLPYWHIWKTKGKKNVKNLYH